MYNRSVACMPILATVKVARSVMVTSAAVHATSIGASFTDMSKKIKEIHGVRPSALTDEDYQDILDAEEGVFYLTKPEMSEVEKLQAAKRLSKAPDGVTYFQAPSIPVDAEWFKVLGTKTGRMSNTDPDLSTIPEFKKRRFIGIAEVVEEPFDAERVMRLT
jgi:hypothetical protein